MVALVAATCVSIFKAFACTVPVAVTVLACDGGQESNYTGADGGSGSAGQLGSSGSGGSGNGGTAGSGGAAASGESNGAGSPSTGGFSGVGGGCPAPPVSVSEGCPPSRPGESAPCEKGTICEYPIVCEVGCGTSLHYCSPDGTWRPPTISGCRSDCETASNEWSEIDITFAETDGDCRIAYSATYNADTGAMSPYTCSSVARNVTDCGVTEQLDCSASAGQDTLYLQLDLDLYWDGKKWTGTGQLARQDLGEPCTSIVNVWATPHM